METEGQNAKGGTWQALPVGKCLGLGSAQDLLKGFKSLVNSAWGMGWTEGTLQHGGRRRNFQIAFKGAWREGLARA